MAMEKQRVTVQQYEDFIARPENRERRFELIDGEIVEMTPTHIHSWIGARTTGRLLFFVEPRNLGHVLVEARYQMPHEKHNAYIPDISFIAGAEIVFVEHGPIMRMPDLAIEIKSPDDSYTDMRSKAAYYLANGSRMVWLVYPEMRMVEVYRKGSDVEILLESDTIGGGDLLPGFALPVRDIFPTE
jgi:Uma2 family endonuclease